MRRWPLFAIAGGSLSLIAARIIWPSLRFDNTSLILFGVAGLAILVAFLPLKRIKWGEFEAELDRAVDDLERKVTASEASPPHHVSKAVAPTSTPQSSWQGFFDEYMALVNSPSSNVEKIIAASILLEKMIDSFVASIEPELKLRGRGPRVAIDRLAENSLITPQERDAFRNLWEVRNKIVHEGLQPTDEQTARLLDLVWRLVRTLA
jgi:uncharacterized protein YutE (UPF0331/DUF86 family)